MTGDRDSKIIVDDDWKEQVRKEKEQLAEQSESSSTTHSQIPDASFALLVTTLTTQALASLGFIPNPETGENESNRELAKHFIDSLSVLQEKTAGNLSADESELLNQSLHQLRMAYIANDSAAVHAKPQDEIKPSSIELP